MKRIIFLACILIAASAVVAAYFIVTPVQPSPTVRWLSFEEAVRRNETEPRLFLIDVYTDWCGWCKKMDKTTYADPDVARYINDNYWPVKFNAEQRDSVSFAGKVFRYIPERKAHELALSLLSERMSYPSTVFLKQDMSLIQVLPGYMDARKMAPVVAFFIDGQSGSITWPEYERTFKGLPSLSTNR